MMCCLRDVPLSNYGELSDFDILPVKEMLTSILEHGTYYTLLSDNDTLPEYDIV